MPPRRAWRQLGLCAGLLLAVGLSRPALAATPTAPPSSAGDGGSDEPRLDCLQQVSGDLVSIIGAVPYAGERDLAGPGPAAMVPITRGSPRWMSGFNAVLAWENDDCPAFAAFAEHMGYDAYELFDRRGGGRHWVLSDRTGRKNGLFVLRAPAERDRARALIISAPHRGLGLGLNAAAELYVATSAVALLQNTASPCNLQSCGGCMMSENSPCGGCTRASDAAASVDNLQFALFAALVATRRDLRLEYGGQPTSVAQPPTCRAFARLSQGPLTARAATPTPLPDGVARALQARLGAACMCYGVDGGGPACGKVAQDSLYARLANQEPLIPFDPCGQPATQLSGRYLHVESRGLPVATLAAAIKEALPLPSAPSRPASTPTGSSPSSSSGSSSRPSPGPSKPAPR
jgi:hypothetical protein